MFIRCCCSCCCLCVFYCHTLKLESHFHFIQNCNNNNIRGTKENQSSEYSHTVGKFWTIARNAYNYTYSTAQHRTNVYSVHAVHIYTDVKQSCFLLFIHVNLIHISQQFVCTENPKTKWLRCHFNVNYISLGWILGKYP